MIPATPIPPNRSITTRAATATVIGLVPVVLACGASQTPSAASADHAQPATQSNSAPVQPNSSPARPGSSSTQPAAFQPPIRRPAPIEELIRVRCATDASDVYTIWTANIYAVVPGERQRLLFTGVGMNVARCWEAQGRWFLSSRELMYYVDPKTGEVLHRWTNPWTGATVPVIHVANSPVQSPLRGPVPAAIGHGRMTIILDIPLFYPNRLSSEERFSPYSPHPNYQAGEFFALSSPVAEVENPQLASAPDMTFTWHRHGPWLPWMKMGDRPGSLIYSAHGSKVPGYEWVPQLIRDDIDSRLGLYRKAPRCMLDTRNETSWTYFARHIDAYMAGERFPLPAPQVEERCRK